MTIPERAARIAAVQRAIAAYWDRYWESRRTAPLARPRPQVRQWPQWRDR